MVSHPLDIRDRASRSPREPFVNRAKLKLSAHVIVAGRQRGGKPLIING